MEDRDVTTYYNEMVTLWHDWTFVTKMNGTALQTVFDKRKGRRMIESMSFLLDSIKNLIS